MKKNWNGGGQISTESLAGMRESRNICSLPQLLSLSAEGTFLDLLYHQSKLRAIKDDVDRYLRKEAQCNRQD